MTWPSPSQPQSPHPRRHMKPASGGLLRGWTQDPVTAWRLHGSAQLGRPVRPRAGGAGAAQSCLNVGNAWDRGRRPMGPPRPSEPVHTPSMFSGPCPSEVCRRFTRVCDELWAGLTPCVCRLPVDTGCPLL